VLGGYLLWWLRTASLFSSYYKTELEPGLIFRTRTGIGLYVLRTGIGLYVLRTGSGIGFLIHSFGKKVTRTWG
jgi:hypothetical protein